MRARDVILFRADASADIGTGHVMRCLALAQAWRKSGGRAVFVCAELDRSVEQRLRREGMRVCRLRAARGTMADANATAACARGAGAMWIVADGYCFGAGWQSRVRAVGRKLLIIDDEGRAGRWRADLILNQNLSAKAAWYKRTGAQARLLLGPQFALLRPEFSARGRTTKACSNRGRRRVLVTLGGSDPQNVTARVIDALAGVPGLAVRVVAGPSNPNRAALETLVRQVRGVTLLCDGANMPGLMAWADIAVAAGGSTSWELAYMGLPAVQLVLADNQAAIAAVLDRARVGVNLGRAAKVVPAKIAGAVRALLKDSEARRAMAQRARQLVDGHGARRVCAALGAPLGLTIVSDRDSWLNASLPELVDGFEAAGHRVRWVHAPQQIDRGDITFLLSCSQVVPAPILARNAHTLVVHESALPQGRGWSPLTWQVLEGRTEIPVTLLEAGVGVDRGNVYAQERLHLSGGELLPQLRAAQAQATFRLCREFVMGYPFTATRGRPQEGTPSYYPRRTPADSRLDLDKTLREQFNLLRVADPDRYPAYFEHAGRRYIINVASAPRLSPPR